MARGTTIVLIHSSKTMRSAPVGVKPTGAPALLDMAEELVRYVRTLPARTLAKVMTVSADLAERTSEQFSDWTTDPAAQSPAALLFTGDIYSGLQAASFSAADRRYADGHLRILSGLYGVLRPFDGICPYRLEMGHKLPGSYANLYRFWGSAIAEQLPTEGAIINLSANEYGKTVLGFVDPARVVTPKFLTADASGEAKFVVVHAKIARGTFARWLMTARVNDPAALPEFAELGYAYDPARSTPREPVFVCTEFGGLGLSVRLS